MKTLVAGWFSFDNGHATAGDILARDVACRWLDAAGWSYDVAAAPPFTDGVDLDLIDPARYTHLIFVCGPFEQGELEARLISRFGHCRLIGLNLSMQVPLERWRPFDFLIERDSSERSHADMVFLSERKLVPVVGICRVEPFPGAIDYVANAAIDRLAGSREIARLEIDTRLDTNAAGFKTPAEVESMIARTDVLVTTRLHGLVLAIKNGVPVVAIDPIAGGAKICRHAQTIGWPVVFAADEVTDEALERALDYCLSEPARAAASRCAERARKMVEKVRDDFVAAISQPVKLEQNYYARRGAGTDDSWMSVHLPAADAVRPPSSRRHLLGKRVARLVDAIAGRAAKQRASI